MKLLHGGKSVIRQKNGLEILVTSREEPPFRPDVMVFEEDTNLILTVDPMIKNKIEHPIRTMTAILESKKYKPGTVVENGSSWYAVVIDLEREPICEGVWCNKAIKEVFRRAENQQIEKLAIPVLGSVHGGLKLEQRFSFLINTLESMNFSDLRQVWCVVSQKDIKRARNLF